ncbi:MAG: PKD domain-containing protein [Sandaracinaceae bacterium]
MFGLSLAAALCATACDDGGMDGDAGPAGRDGGGGRDAGSDDAGPPPNQDPTAAFGATHDAALHVAVDGSASSDPDGTIVSHVWDFGDGMSGEGATADHTYAAAGCYTITLTVTDDGGATASAQHTLRVIDAAGGTASDFALTGMPRDLAVVPRDTTTNLGTITLGGDPDAVSQSELVVRVFQDTTMEQEIRTSLCGDVTTTVEIAAELVDRRIEASLASFEGELALATASDVVAGDILVVNGQSNAVAAMHNGSADENLGHFIRTFAVRSENVAAHTADDAWHEAESAGSNLGIGQWEIRMVALLQAQYAVPFGVINGARGGQPIDYFARNDADHTDLTTNYGRLLDRVRRAGLDSQIRAILWYQGESDGGNAMAHHDGFVQLYQHWQEDFPDVERFYVTQVRLGCGGQIQTREVQRQLATELPRTTVMSTTGIDAHDGCHYAYVDGYRVLGDRYAALLARDLYGAPPGADVEAIDVMSASVVGNQVVIETRSDASAITVDPGVEAFFRLTGGTRTITAVSASGSQVLVDVTAGTDPTQVSFEGHSGAGPWVTNANGVGLLAFRIPVGP